MVSNPSRINYTLLYRCLKRQNRGGAIKKDIPQKNYSRFILFWRMVFQFMRSCWYWSKDKIIINLRVININVELCIDLVEKYYPQYLDLWNDFIIIYFRAEFIDTLPINMVPFYIDCDQRKLFF